MERVLSGALDSDDSRKVRFSSPRKKAVRRNWFGVALSSSALAWQNRQVSSLQSGSSACPASKT